MDGPSYISVKDLRNKWRAKEKGHQNDILSIEVIYWIFISAFKLRKLKTFFMHWFSNDKLSS